MNVLGGGWFFFYLKKMFVLHNFALSFCFEPVALIGRNAFFKKKKAEKKPVGKQSVDWKRFCWLAVCSREIGTLFFSF